MERKNVVGLILVALSVGIVVYAVQPYIPWLTPPANLPGDQPQTTWRTGVVVKHGIIGDPYIETITSTQVSGQGFAIEEKSEIMLFPWEGVLKLEVTSPDGHRVTLSKAIKIEMNEKKTFYFTWTTRQTGQHTLLATLTNKDGTVVNQKQEVVYV